jgi:hypothetical protein
LVAQAQSLLPPGRQIIFLGDGEFDSPGLLASVQEAGWHFVCRTAKNVRLAEADWPDETFCLSDLMFTTQGLGPGLVGAVWETGLKEPLLLVSSLDFLDDARAWYRRRFGIETLFSDQKSLLLLRPQPPFRPDAFVSPADGDMPCVLLDGLSGRGSSPAGLAGRHSSAQAL